MEEGSLKDLEEGAVKDPFLALSLSLSFSFSLSFSPPRTHEHTSLALSLHIISLERYMSPGRGIKDQLLAQPCHIWSVVECLCSCFDQK